MTKAKVPDVPKEPEGGELPGWVQGLLMVIAFVLAGVFGWYML